MPRAGAARGVTRRLAIEAGHRDVWYKYVGLDGRVVGMSTFGESGKAGGLFQHFGFTVDHLKAEVERLLATRST